MKRKCLIRELYFVILHLIGHFELCHLSGMSNVNTKSEWCDQIHVPILLLARKYLFEFCKRKVFSLSRFSTIVVSIFRRSS